MTRQTLHILLITITTLSGCDVPKKSAEEIAKQEQEQALAETESRALDPIREGIVTHLKSDAEPTTKDAIWITDYGLQIAVKNEGGRYDGYAEYICTVLRDFKFTANATVQILDWRALVVDKEYKTIGSTRCIYNPNPEPPVEVDFTK